MDVVYIVAPYRSKSIIQKAKNIAIARHEAKKWWARGFAVLCPHSNSAFFDHVGSDELFLDGYKEFVKRCDILALLPNWRLSSGSIEEVKLGKKLGKWIIFHNARIISVPPRYDYFIPFEEFLVQRGSSKYIFQSASSG